jgi:tetratricopeptide (TPR) repeat protein
MKDFKDRRKYFYRPWIIRVLVMILAVSGLRGAGRHSPAWNEPSVSCQAVDDLIKQGDDLYKQGRYDEAIAAFTKAIELNSRNGVAFRKRGEAKYGQSDLQGAIVDAGKAILLDPMDYISYSLRGVCLFVLGRYDESLEDCETAISIEPKFADGYINRARIKRVKKDYSGALSDVKKALEIEPGSPAGKVLLKQIEFTMAGGSTAPDSAPPGQDRKFLKVNVLKAEVRVAPDVTVPVIYPVKLGEQLKYMARVGDWYQVFLSDNDDDDDSPSGFIIASAVDVIMVKITEQDKYITAERQIAKIASPIADYIIDNALLPVLEKPEDCQLKKESLIYKLLVPKYTKNLPLTDPWGGPYEIFFGNNPWGKACLEYFGIQEQAGDDFLVISKGKLGAHEIWKYDAKNPEAGLYSEFDARKNIINYNGAFIRGKKK